MSIRPRGAERPARREIAPRRRSSVRERPARRNQACEGRTDDAVVRSASRSTSLHNASGPAPASPSDQPARHGSTRGGARPLRHAEQARSPKPIRGSSRLWTLRGNLHFRVANSTSALRRTSARSSSPVRRITRGHRPRARGLGDAQYQRGRMRTARLLPALVELCEQHGLAGLRLTYLPISRNAGVRGRACSGDRTEQQAAETRARSATEANCSRQHLCFGRHLPGASRRCARKRRARPRAGARTRRASGSSRRARAAGCPARVATAREARATLEEAVALSRIAAPTYCGPWALGAGTRERRPQASRAARRGRRAAGSRLREHNHLEFHCSRSRWAARGRSCRRWATRRLSSPTRATNTGLGSLVVARARVLAAVVEAEQRLRGPRRAKSSSRAAHAVRDAGRRCFSRCS